MADFLLNLQVSLSLMKSSSKMPHAPFSRAVQGSALKELALAIIKFMWEEDIMLKRDNKALQIIGQSYQGTD